MAKTYKIIRFHYTEDTEFIQGGLSLDEAQHHCKRDDTRAEDEDGHMLWFDGYEEE